MIINDLPTTTNGGIYAIVNAADFKIYIGMSGNLKRRAETHDTKLRNGNHENTELLKDAEKNLRYIVLFEDVENISRVYLQVLEYLYMYVALFYGFTLYNEIPGKRARSAEDFARRIFCILTGGLNLKKHFNDVIKKEYGEPARHWQYKRKDRRPDADIFF